MDQLTSKKSILDQIRLYEGEGFEYDEQAILQEYQIKKDNESSLAIKILSIFGGFLAMLAFIGFIVLAGLYNSELGLTVLGVGAVISAILLTKEFNRLIIDTFSISLYVTGLALFSIGLEGIHLDENTIVILIVIIAILSLVITQNFMLSFIALVTIGAGLLFLIFENKLYNLVHLYVAVYAIAIVFVFLNEAKLISINKKVSELYNPLRIGLVFSLLLGLIAIGKKNLIPIDQNQVWLSSIIIIPVLLYLINIILKINQEKDKTNKTKIYLLSVMILASTLFSPAISGAIIIILLSFLVNYKTGLGIGIVAIVYFVSQYYYDLNFTLLTKSIILFVSGIMFLGLYYITIKKLGE